jgi:hypothetical protein
VNPKVSRRASPPLSAQTSGPGRKGTDRLMTAIYSKQTFTMTRGTLREHSGCSPVCGPLAAARFWTRNERRCRPLASTVVISSGGPSRPQTRLRPRRQI